jgi:hypothetical protein
VKTWRSRDLEQKRLIYVFGIYESVKKKWKNNEYFLMGSDDGVYHYRLLGF